MIKHIYFSCRYGGGETINQPWPLESEPRSETPYVNTEMFYSPERSYSGVTEAYWVSSKGLAVVVSLNVLLRIVNIVVGSSSYGICLCISGKVGKFSAQWCCCSDY